MDEVIREFVIETREGLDRADRDLIVLEQDSKDQGTLRTVFRTIHTIKGTCGFLGFLRLQELAHAGEHLLSRLRSGAIVLRPEMISALLRLVDTIRRALVTIENTGTESAEDNSELAVLLTQLASPQGPAPLPLDAASATSLVPTTAPPAPHAREATPVAPPARPAPIAPLAPATPVAPPARPAPFAPPAPAAPPSEADRVFSQRSGQEATDAPLFASNTTVRVNVSLLDKVMNLIGELVLARNQVLQARSRQSDPVLQRLSHITTDLQESVVQMRMQPISSLFSGLPRMARDLAMSCHKTVQLRMEGHETELDRSMLEAIKDPLVHLLRNAIDHGIEPAAARLAAGKPDAGSLTLRAYYEERHVAIEVSDDGAGIDRARLRGHAVQQGVLGRAEAEAMSDREALNLVFLPGFTTAPEVTKLSGRGVGLDVVKTNIESIGGSIELQTSVGEGTTVKLSIPLTLAIMPAMIVRAGAERFAIPQAALLEIVRLDPEQASRVVDHVQDVPLYRLRGRLLSLVYLDEHLWLSAPRSSSQRIALQGLTIVVVQVEERRFGLVVDEICDTEEIVVKPLGRELKGMRIYAGATIMGDGRVALILDVAGIAERAGVFSEENQLRLTEVSEPASPSTQRGALLLFRGPDDARMALPARAVSRLERIDPNVIEKVAGRDMVRHRDTILPLVHIEDVVLERRRTPRNKDAPSADGLLDVIVCSVEGQTFGLVVCSIDDIVDDTSNVRREGGRLGILATAVVDDRLTELVDMTYFASTLDRQDAHRTRPHESEVRDEH